MIMKKLAKRCTNLEEILDSDDELPSDYTEIPIVPAYQDDNRFGYIREHKINNEETNNKSSLLHATSEKIPSMKPCRYKTSETVLLKGYLTKRDTFCFLSLEPTSNENTLLWFFNFLMLKDLQSNYAFLNTCLVPNYNNNYPGINNDSLNDYEKHHSLKVKVYNKDR